ncbi:hypothetical protein [Bacillus thuringiensis]|uniref:hypothetical protein n=1 Tax=Bacillus thuringiensis TaxID=1428 RepID=UPI000BF61682|nr:hypothetical protein [Bacillus thuringiensis]PEY76285.1 hypothetical protein CN355_02880 [Bacillus thuringiensis]PGT92217.1 hypothetical protein COD18_15400 [Bacillus cereus]
MKLELKFNDGIIVTITNFGDLPRLRNSEDLFDVLQSIKDNDSPINITDAESGQTFSGTGKDLKSVEIILA